MGVENPNPISSDLDRITSRGYTDFSTNQFYLIEKHGEPPIARQGFDNPAFSWPSNLYRDVNGNTYKIQRGYLRSLITDPSLTISQGAKNRRLFFQFNPQVLVRSVQQSVGAMNPLLQDPAQLMQAVPGTASFGFELLFNREQEVATGENGDMSDPFNLPTGGGPALVSRIGVLADLLVLDTITGQGLSQDLMAAVSSLNARQLQQQQQENEAALREAKEAGDDEFLKSYRELEVPSDEAITKVFTANIGNSAFLNPIPFRAVFSSLFMVEGLPTSVDVKFTKFSRTMVPTMCTVTINMYALYIGFAKKNTFLYDNLSQAKEEFVDTQTKVPQVELTLKSGIQKILSTMTFDDDKLEDLEVSIETTSLLRRQLSERQINDGKIEIEFKYKLVTESEPIPTADELDLTAKLYYNGESEIDLDKFFRRIEDSPTGSARNNFPKRHFKSPEMNDQLKKRDSGETRIFGILFVYASADVNGTRARTVIAAIPSNNGDKIEFLDPPGFDKRTHDFNWTKPFTARPN